MANVALLAGLFVLIVSGLVVLSRALLNIWCGPEQP